jgi:hypothetical protein
VAILQNVLALILAGAGSIVFPQAGPPLDLDPDRAHIRIFAPSHWGLKFYGRSDLSGDPVVELTDEGLRIDGRVVCRWPGGRWDERRETEMVLGYSSVDAGVYRPCVPPGLPLISTWSDSGRGTAAIYVEVAARREAIVESRWGARRLYLDLNTLPGDPREPIPDASLRLRTRGFLGWEWLLSKHEEQRQTHAAYSRLLREPAFRHFMDGVRSCLTSKHVPGCLVPFVGSPFYHRDAAAALGKDGHVTAAELVRYAWAAVGESGGTGKAWDDLRSCLLDGEPISVTQSTVQLSGAVVCDVERGPNAWKLTAFFAGG